MGEAAPVQPPAALKKGPQSLREIHPLTSKLKQINLQTLVGSFTIEPGDGSRSDALSSALKRFLPEPVDTEKREAIVSWMVHRGFNTDLVKAGEKFTFNAGTLSVNSADGKPKWFFVLFDGTYEVPEGYTEVNVRKDIREKTRRAWENLGEVAAGGILYRVLQLLNYNPRDYKARREIWKRMQNEEVLAKLKEHKQLRKIDMSFLTAEYANGHDTLQNRAMIEYLTAFEAGKQFGAQFERLPGETADEYFFRVTRELNARKAQEPPAPEVKETFPPEVEAFRNVEDMLLDAKKKLGDHLEIKGLTYRVNELRNRVRALSVYSGLKVGKEYNKRVLGIIDDLQKYQEEIDLALSNLQGAVEILKERIGQGVENKDRLGLAIGDLERLLKGFTEQSAALDGISTDFEKDQKIEISQEEQDAYRAEVAKRTQLCAALQADLASLRVAASPQGDRARAANEAPREQS